MTRRFQSGSILLESVIAVAIVAVAAGLMASVVVDGALRSRASEIKRLEVMTLQSRLASVGSEIALVPGSVSGVDGFFNWEVTIHPFRTAIRASNSGTLYLVVVGVWPRNGHGKAIELRSLRVASAQ